LKVLKGLANYLPVDFDKATQKDLKKLVAGINQSDYSKWTKQDFKVVLKILYKWLGLRKIFFDEKTEELWLKGNNHSENDLQPEDLPTDEEILKLAEVAGSQMEKTLVLTLGESGARAGELLTMKIESVEFGQPYTRISLVGKTGKRTIPVRNCTPALSRWIDVHPQRDNLKAPLWVGLGTKNQKRQMSYASLNAMLRKLRERAGIEKRLNPHVFRHRKATKLAKILNEAQLCMYMGWKVGSKMPATYLHMTHQDLEDAMAGFYGIPKTKPLENSILTYVTCPRCNLSHSAGTSVCVCGLRLDEDTLQNYEKNQAEEIEMRDVKKLLKALLDSGQEHVLKTLLEKKE